MNDQQSQISRAAIARAHGFFPSQMAFSMTTGIPASSLSKMLNGQYEPSPVHAALIEKFTGGKVKRHEIRPDVYPPPGSKLAVKQPPRGVETPAALAKVSEALGLSAVVRDLEAKHSSGTRPRPKSKAKAAKAKVK